MEKSRGIKKKFIICNLYCGIGGNRKNWDKVLKGFDYEIVAVEHDPKIAKIYQDFFPNDKVVVGDAHQYLLDHYKEFDFIWSSPPCPTHSIVRFIAMGRKERPQKPVYPDMKLYEEILLLQHYFRGKYCVENVIAFYKPLIEPKEFERHWFWTNFTISQIETGKSRSHYGSIEELQERKGFDISKYKGIDRRKTLRNCVEPDVGKHILDQAITPPQTLL